MGRRLRRTYLGIFAIQTFAYLGKIVVHPATAASWSDILDRASIGPVSGALVLSLGAIYNAGWIALALTTSLLDARGHAGTKAGVAMG